MHLLQQANTKWLKVSTGKRPVQQPSTLRASTTAGRAGARDGASGQRSENRVRARAGSERKLSRTKHDCSSSSLNHQHHSRHHQNQHPHQHHHELKPKGASVLSFVDTQAEVGSTGA